ncbi:MAG: fumarylacetoacetate hydrolase family protein [Bacteroidia bacterium]|nr:fumarylacetoacetate hydrolase family protein [Bacteroidia bacterium]
MKRILKILAISLAILIVIVVLFGLFLNRGLKYAPQPAQFECLDISDGAFITYDTFPKHIYGIGLAYAGHINETAADFDPKTDPPIFRKAIGSLLINGGDIRTPDRNEMFGALEKLEPGISKTLERISDFPALLDYEVELGVILLDDINAEALLNEDFVPNLGFFIANDLGARSVAILGEGQINRYDYWGISKSFYGFTAIDGRIWIPGQHYSNGLPCIDIETRVNGEIRQKQSTADLIYTPRQMLRAIHRKYPDTPLKKGDLVLTGTPGGVAMSAPRWLVRLASIIGMDRWDKLAHKTSEEDIAKFLKAGDEVITSAEGLGSVKVVIR